MRRRTRQLLVQLAFATAMAIIGISVISSSAAVTSAVQRGTLGAPRPMAARQERPPAPTDDRLSDRQQLRRILLGESSPPRVR